MKQVSCWGFVHPCMRFNYGRDEKCIRESLKLMDFRRLVGGILLKCIFIGTVEDCERNCAAWRRGTVGVVLSTSGKEQAELRTRQGNSKYFSECWGKSELFLARAEHVFVSDLGFSQLWPRRCVSWDVTPCSLVDVWWRFRGSCYLSHPDFWR